MSQVTIRFGALLFKLWRQAWHTPSLKVSKGWDDSAHPYGADRRAGITAANLVLMRAICLAPWTISKLLRPCAR